MRGQLVIVRSYLDKMSIMKVWDVGKRVIYVVSNEQYRLLLKNDPMAVGPIGIQKKDVYSYDPKYADPNRNQNFDWSQIKRFAD